jgi:hypothetical protein
MAHNSFRTIFFFAFENLAEPCRHVPELSDGERFTGVSWAKVHSSTSASLVIKVIRNDSKPVVPIERASWRRGGGPQFFRHRRIQIESDSTISGLESGVSNQSVESAFRRQDRRTFSAHIADVQPISLTVQTSPRGSTPNWNVILPLDPGFPARAFFQQA